MTREPRPGEVTLSPATSPGGDGTPTDYVISSDCMDCGVCEYMCPQGAILEAKKQFVIRRGVCNGCGECVPYCPARAIVPRTSFKERQERTVHNLLGGALGLSKQNASAESRRAVNMTPCGQVPDAGLSGQPSSSADPAIASV